MIRTHCAIRGCKTPTQGGGYRCSRHVELQRGYALRYVSRNGVRNWFTLRGTREWAEWLHGLADKQQTTVSELLDTALWEIADQCGYPEPPPRLGKPIEEV